MRIGCAGQREDCVNDRLDMTRGEERQPAFAETSRDVNFFNQRTSTEHGAEDPQSFAHNEHQARFYFDAPHRANQHEPTAGFQAAQVPLPIFGPDEILDQIDSLLMCDLLYPLGKISFLIVTSGVCAEVEATLNLFSGTGSD